MNAGELVLHPARDASLGSKPQSQTSFMHLGEMQLLVAKQYQPISFLHLGEMQLKSN